MVLGSNQPLTEMSTRSISWATKWPVRKADNFTTTLGHCHIIWQPYLPGSLWAPRACKGTILPFYPITRVWATVSSASFHTIIKPTRCDRRCLSDKIMSLLRRNSLWLVSGKWG